MKVLVVGGGGREHAIVKAIKKSNKIKELYCAPGNGGIGRDAENVPIKANDIPSMTEFALKQKIDYAVVAPDDPLALGMVDALNKKGIRCFGPDKAAARIESSKVFSKNLMKKYGIPTASYESFNDFSNARQYALNVSYPVWIKADGLALGKGAVFADNAEKALKILDSLMVKKVFGESGSRVVIEENMRGREVTVLAFTDGKTIVPMISSMDYKRALDGDKGLNTGGMGVIAPNPFYTDEIAVMCKEKIFLPTVKAMQEEGCPFKGCLYFGLILTEQGPKVIEYNSRFGDPETQAILPLLETDLLEIMEAVTDGKLDSADVRFRNGASVCIVLASGGYPESYKTGFEISGLNENGRADGVTIYHAGTQYENGKFLTSGGRVLGVTALGESLSSALEKAYKASECISFEGAFYRKDIGR